MRFFNLMLLLTFTLVLLSSYLLLSLNKEVVLIDLLFIEIELSLGGALLSFFFIGFLTTLVLELLSSFRRKKIEE